MRERIVDCAWILSQPESKQASKPASNERSLRSNLCVPNSPSDFVVLHFLCIPFDTHPAELTEQHTNHMRQLSLERIQRRGKFSLSSRLRLRVSSLIFIYEVAHVRSSNRVFTSRETSTFFCTELSHLPDSRQVGSRSCSH